MNYPLSEELQEGSYFLKFLNNTAGIWTIRVVLTIAVILFVAAYIHIARVNKGKDKK